MVKLLKTKVSIIKAMRSGELNGRTQHFLEARIRLTDPPHSHGGPEDRMAEMVS